MDNSVRQHTEEPQKPLTRYQQLKERLLQKILARIAKADKSGSPKKEKDI